MRLSKTAAFACFTGARGEPKGERLYEMVIVPVAFELLQPPPRWGNPARNIHGRQRQAEVEDAFPSGLGGDFAEVIGCLGGEPDGVLWRG